MDERLEDEWRTFELYEKIRLRERRKKLLISSLALILFFSLCAVPVVEERSPKWKSLRAAQRLSVEVEKLKTLAIHEKKPARITFLNEGVMKIEILDDCKNETGTLFEQKEWKDESGALKILSPVEARTFDVKLAIDQICFDPVFGLDEIKRRVLVIAPVKDLTEHRLDRASYVIMDGDSAKISIN
jgi:hypothetical protein